MGLINRLMAWWDSPRPFILRALLRGDAYGRVVRERIRVAGCPIDSGRMYVLLAAMEDDGLVTAVETGGDDGLLPRRLYSLTAKGREAAQ